MKNTNIANSMLADDFRNHLNGHRQFLLENAKSERDSSWKEAVDEAKRDTKALVLAQTAAQNSKALADITQKAETLKQEKEDLKRRAGEEIRKKEAEAAHLARQRDQLAEVARKSIEQADAQTREAQQAQQHANNIKREAEIRMRQAYEELNRMHSLLQRMKRERAQLPPGEEMDTGEDEPESTTPIIEEVEEKEQQKEKAEELLALEAPPEHKEIPKEKEEEEQQQDEGKRKEEETVVTEEEQERGKKRTKKVESEAKMEEIKVPEPEPPEEIKKKGPIDEARLPKDVPSYSEKAIAEMKKNGFNPDYIKSLETDVIRKIQENPKAAIYAFENEGEINRFINTRRGSKAIMEAKQLAIEKFILRYQDYLSGNAK